MPAEEFGYRGKMRRRKRVAVGTAFDSGLGDQLDALQPLKDAGLYCKPCGKWHKWKELDMLITSIQGVFVRSWVCKKTGQYIKEEDLT